jgi:ubiquinone/menaquinone biosynthesis C-methylase UbiE
MASAGHSDVLERAAPLLRPSGASDVAPVARGDELVDPRSGRTWRLDGGILDLLGDRFAPTPTQRMLDTRATAWLYDQARDVCAPLIGMPDFTTEARDVAARLALAPGDVVVDVACGHGNFTLELARRVGEDGLAIGLDISAAMLARAAARVRRDGARNVLLVRGDALQLPFADGAVPALLCSGGLHQLPDLDRALAEFARVLSPGGRLAASGFAEAGEGSPGWRRWLRRRLALHVVPLAPLARALGAAGFGDVATCTAGPLGYAWARRAPSARP